MNHTTYKAAIRKCGGVKKLRSEFKKIENALKGVKIFACHQFNEEEPEDMTQDWLNIIIEYNPVVYGNFSKALDDVIAALYKVGLFLCYECNGDGNETIIMSYRVKSY